MSRWFSHYMEMLGLFNLILQTPRLEQPAGDRGERLFRAEDKIGPGRDIWKALPSRTHTTTPGTLKTHAIWDPLKKGGVVCVCRYL